jgi:threonine dehydrogenase-like Zn-dependent dehydrogenase
VHSQYVGAGGAQAPRLRVPLADGTLVATPDLPSANLIPSLLATSDVLGTGWFGADAANVRPGKTVAVVGDGRGEPLRGARRQAIGRRAHHRHEPS